MAHTPDDTRSRILQAALGLFSRMGYDAAGVAEICEAAGVSKGAFYHHFPSKHAVFMRLLEDWLAELRPDIEQLFLHSKDIPSGLMEMTGLAPQIFAQAENNLPMFLEFWTQANRDPLVWKATIAPYRQFLDMFSAYLRRGVEEGSLEAVEPDHASRLILALVLGMILQGMMEPEAVNWSQAIQEGMALLLKGMRRREA